MSGTKSRRKRTIKDLKDPNDDRPMASSYDILVSVKQQRKQHKNNDEIINLMIQRLTEDPKAEHSTIEDWARYLGMSEKEFEEAVKLPAWQRKSHREKIERIFSRCKIEKNEL